jgi:hypothetical protein
MISRKSPGLLRHAADIEIGEGHEPLGRERPLKKAEGNA